MRTLHVALVLSCALVCGCAATGARHTPETRYQYLLLDTRKLGADELARVQEDDPAIRSYVAANGTPDFILVTGPDNVELIYYLRSVLAQFHRPSAGAPSVMGVLSPLPDAVLGNLPQDIRAGTPAREPSPADCWTVPVGGLSCKTCCAAVDGPANCVSSCKHPR